MNSGLYECTVMHHRFSPRVHHFAYRIFYFAVDLDEWESLGKALGCLSLNRFNLFSFREKDYLPTSEVLHAPTGEATSAATAPRSLKQRVQDFFAAQGVDASGAKIWLVTLPRVLGYGFNPVSFYYAVDAQGRSLGAIAEVTNTFHEIKPYFLRPADALPPGQAEGFRRRVAKDFYVSPFSAVDLEFDFTLRRPGERLSVQIDTYDKGERRLTSTLNGKWVPLTEGRLWRFALKYPLLSFAVIARIHWHALRLWLKKVPWFAKAARPERQRNLYRPHSSLVPPPA